MRLLTAVFGFLFRKVGALVGLLAILFVGYLAVQAAVPAVRHAAADLDRLEALSQERATLEQDLASLREEAAAKQFETVQALQETVGAEVEESRRAVTEKRADLERLSEDRDEICDLVQELIDLVTPGNKCQAAEAAVAAADDALGALEGGLKQAEEDAAVLGDPDLTVEQKAAHFNRDGAQSVEEQEVAAQEARLDKTRAEESKLRKAQESGAGWVVNQWSKVWRWLLAIALIVLVLPPLMRVVNYFVFMPLVHRMHRPIRLAGEPVSPNAALHCGEAQRTLPLQVRPGEVLSARSEHVRPVEGKVSSRLLYEWRSPFISFAAGLYGLSRVSGGEAGSAVTLAASDDPNAYLMRIDFEDHPGVVIHPKHMVGVVGSPSIQTRWRWGIHVLATGQVRYIMFAGTGSLIVEGHGDVVATTPAGGPLRMEQHLVMGFDSRLSVGFNRTEVFWPYLWGRTSLVDDEFTGQHPLLWQKSSAENPSNPLARSLGAVFSAIGKIFGF